MVKKRFFLFITSFLVILFLPLCASATYFGEKNRFVLSGIAKKHITGITDKGEVFVYQKKSGKFIGKTEPKYFHLNSGISANGEYAALVYQEKDTSDTWIDIIHTKDQKVVNHFKTVSKRININKVQLSDDGAILLLANDHGANPNQLYKTSNGKVLWSEKKTTELSNTLRPDGKVFIKTDYILFGRSTGCGRGPCSIQLFSIDKQRGEISPLRKVSLNHLRVQIRKRFGRIENSITSYTFSKFDDNVLLINYLFKEKSGKNYQYFIAKLDLTTSKVLAIMDYGLTEETSLHWNSSYADDNTLCELTRDVFVAGYEGRILIGDFSTNRLVAKEKRTIIMRNDTLPDIGCYSDDKSFVFSDTRSKNKNKPAIYLMKYGKGKVQPFVSKLAIKELETAEREAKIAVAKKRKEEEDRRKAVEKAKKEKLKRISKSLNSRKDIGDFICLAGKQGFFIFKFDVMLQGYVEGSRKKKIQIRITSHGQNANYNGVTLYRDSIIWDDYDNWYDCSLND